MLKDMWRISSILLIPFLVLGPVLPHSHALSGVVVPVGHDSRPHVHLNSHDHSHSHDQHHHGPSKQLSPKSDTSSLASELAPLVDHDLDAIYLAASDALPRTCPTISVEVVATYWVALPIRVVVESISRFSAADPPDMRGPLPIYLLNSSLLL